MNNLRIIFRKSGDKNQYIDCIFIDSMPENHSDQLTCYANIGQHSTCSTDWVYETKPATKDEYTSLLNEVSNIYNEYNLVVLDRLPSKTSLRLKAV